MKYHEFEVDLDDEHIDYIREHGPVSLDIGMDTPVLLWLEYDKVADKEFLRIAKDTSDD